MTLLSFAATSTGCGNCEGGGKGVFGCVGAAGRVDGEGYFLEALCALDAALPIPLSNLRR
jgi:hypothetical protein